MKSTQNSRRRQELVLHEFVTGLSTRYPQAALHFLPKFRNLAADVHILSCARVIANYYTLLHVAGDLHRVLAGLPLTSAFSQHRHELVLTFGAAETHSVIARCEPSGNALYLRDDFHRARRNSVEFFEEAYGETVASTDIAHNDRSVSIVLSSGRRILLQMFGSRANVLLMDASAAVVGSFRKLSAATSPRTSEPTPDDSGPFPLRLRAIGTRAPQLPAALKRLDPTLGSILVQEVLVRCALDASRTVDSLTDRDIDALGTVLAGLRGQLLAPPVPRIYLDGPRPVVFSVIPLLQYERFRFEQFESIHEAIRAYLSAVHRHREAAGDRAALGELLQKEFDHTSHALEKIRAEAVSPDREDELEETGKLLIAHLHELAKGSTSAALEGRAITLDPHLTPARNAERYFERARKARAAREDQRSRLTTLEHRLGRLEELLEEWNDAVTPDAVRAFTDGHREDLERFGIVRNAGGIAKREPLPFRVFEVDGGFQVWAGKSSENNDLLTTRHTAKNDLWFHARGVGGSHVVLKAGTGKGEFSKRAIQQAAAIAAYYSKMKNASHVPVTMCEGKYVRKPRGVPAGTVHVERETTVFADPALPAGSTE